MKKLLTLVPVCFSLLLSAQRFPAGEFFYTVPFPVERNQALRAAWWHEYMDLPQHTAFFQPILDLADSGKIDVYNPEFPFSTKMPLAEVHLLLHKTDTVYPDYDYLYDDPGYYVMYHDITANNIVSISFREEWQYDSIAKTLLKNVKGITLNAREGETDFPLFYIPFDGKGNNRGYDPSPIAPFTYDFLPDSLQRKENYAETRVMLRAMVNAKKNIFYGAKYPFINPVPKKDAEKNKAAYRSSNTMEFFEEWNVDLNTMVFTKNVHGVVLKAKGVVKMQQAATDSDEINVETVFAFLPLNGYVPATFVPAKVVIPDFIYRENFFANPLVPYGQTVFSDSAALMKMCIGICNLAENKKISPYYYSAGSFYSGDKTKYTSAGIDSLFAHAHDAGSPDPDFYGGAPFCYPKTGGLGFKENWIYDPQKNTFEKQVQSLAFLSTQFVNVQEANFRLPLFYLDLPPVKDTAAILKPEFLVAENIHVPVMIDHAWETDEEERRYNPQAFKNESAMGPSLRYHFVQQALDNALAGKVAIYDGAKAGLPLTPSQLQVKINSLKDSSFIKADLPADYLLFQEIVFVEDWYFNSSTGEFYKKVKELVFVNSDNFVSPYNIDFEKQNPVFAIKLN